MSEIAAQNLQTSETLSLIGSDKVEGTSLRRPNGEHVGKIERLMIDKASGKVAYAVASFGGFLGLGERRFALPWSALRYNPAQDAYEVDVSEEQLDRAPPIAETSWNDAAWNAAVFQYYGAVPFWY
jgi:hypothetical protein